MHTSTQLVRFGQKQYGTYFSDQRYLFCHVKLLFFCLKANTGESWAVTSKFIASVT